MGPRGLTASKAPRPFLDGEDLRAAEEGRLVLGWQHRGRALQPLVPLLYKSLVAPPSPASSLSPSALHSWWRKPALLSTQLASGGARSPRYLSCLSREMGRAHGDPALPPRPPETAADQQLPTFAKHFGASPTVSQPTRPRPHR